MKKEGVSWKDIVLFVTVFGWGISVGYFKSSYVPNSVYQADMKAKDVEIQALKDLMKDELHARDEKIWQNADNIDDFLDEYLSRFE